MHERSFETLQARGRPPLGRQTFFVGFLLVGLGLAQIQAFGSFAMARVAEIVGNQAVEFAQTGFAVADDGHARAVESRDASLSWLERAAPYRDMTVALVVQGYVENESADRTVLTVAREHAERATALSPIDPLTLSLLAYVNAELGDNVAAGRALELANRLVPYWPESADAVSHVGMQIWADLNPDQKRMLTTTLRAYAIRDPKGFAQLATQMGMVGPVTEAFAPHEKEAYAMKIALRDLEDERQQILMDEEDQARLERFRSQQQK